MREWKWRDNLEELGVDGRVMSNTGLEMRRMVRFGLDLSGLVHGQIVGPCERSGAVSIAQKYRTALDRPTNCLSLKDSVILHFLLFLHFLILFPVILFPCRCALVISVYSFLQIFSFCFSFFSLRNFLSTYRAN